MKKKCDWMTNLPTYNSKRYMYGSIQTDNYNDEIYENATLKGGKVGFTRVKPRAVIIIFILRAVELVP